MGHFAVTQGRTGGLALQQDLTCVGDPASTEACGRRHDVFEVDPELRDSTADHRGGGDIDQNVLVVDAELKQSVPGVVETVIGPEDFAELDVGGHKVARSADLSADAAEDGKIGEAQGE
jgi:hypothetical protein